MSEAKKQKTGGEESSKVALITGITGQDGSYLAELLLKKGYTVHGVIRRSSSFNTGRIEELYEVRHILPSCGMASRLQHAALRPRAQDPHCDTRKLVLHYGDLTDSTNCYEIVSKVKPDELYNLGAQSHVKVRAPYIALVAPVGGRARLRSGRGGALVAA